jgi:CRP-like cAMP-binding protein
MERRIVSALQAGDSATQEEKELLEAFLREHFFREYYSPLPFHALKQYFQLKEYAAGKTIFQQGDDVSEYCFLVLGRVMVTRRERMQ